MSDVVAKFLEPFSYFIYSVGFIISIGWKKSVKKNLLLLYYIFSTGITFYACLLAYLKTLGDNNWLYNFFFLITVIALSFYFHQTLASKGKKHLVKFILLVNILLFIWYDVILEKFWEEYNNYVVAFCFLSIVVYSFLYFHELITNVNEQSILLDFDFWLISGYLLYFLGAFFVVLFYKNASVVQRSFLWGLHSGILFLSSVITLAGSLWMINQKKLA